MMSHAEGQQRDLIRRIECLPTSGLLSSLDQDLLMLKATSMATMTCLNDCFHILQLQHASHQKGALPPGKALWKVGLNIGPNMERTLLVVLILEKSFNKGKEGGKKKEATEGISEPLVWIITLRLCMILPNCVLFEFTMILVLISSIIQCTFRDPILNMSKAKLRIHNSSFSPKIVAILFILTS